MPTLLQKHCAFASVLLALALAVGTAVPALAQAPYLVHDINTTVPDSIQSSIPSRFFSFDGRALFVVKNGTKEQLWISDLTEGGTVAVTSQEWVQNLPLNFMGQVNSVVLFSASESPATGVELWRTDGTEAGTYLLKDINAGAGHSFPQPGATLNGVYYFGAEDSFGRELWRTDGTESGTYRLKDIALGVDSSTPTFPITFNDAVYFGARGGLWKTDGSEEGTVEVFPGLVSYPKAVVGSTLFFYGNDPLAGAELWATDGSSTWRVRDINPGAGSSVLFYNVAVEAGGSLLFFADDGVTGTELWKSDGTELGTVLVRDINPSSSSVTGVIHAAKVGETLYFSATNGVAGRELWKSDGTFSGTSMVRDINPGTPESIPAFLNEAGGELYFIADDGTRGRELWRSDGSEFGTQIVADIFPGTWGALQFAPGLLGIGPRVIFGAESPSMGAEPWVSDGTPEGTSIIRNIAAEGGGSSHPTELTAVGNSLFFKATDAVNGYELWVTNSTSTSMVPELVPGPDSTWPSDLGRCGQFLCFASQNKLWRTDGTAEATANVFQNASRVIDVEGVTFVVENSNRLYRLHEDGTTELLASANLTGPLLSAQGILYFVDTWSIRKSDGTPAGTQTVRTFAEPYLQLLGYSNGTIFFTTGYSPRKLWRTNGTYESTELIGELGNKFVSGAIRAVDVNGTLFFAMVENGFTDLWKSDGTSAGTAPLRTGFRSFSDGRSQPVNLNGQLLFVADDGIAGEELWISDGTSAGTRLVKNIRPGYTSVIRHLVVADGIAYFQANDGVSGTELWRSDGTAEGTQLVYDISLGGGSSSPEWLTQLGDTLYFAASTVETGRELWAYPLPDDISISATGFQVNENGGTGSFRVSLSRAATTTVTVRARVTDGTALDGHDYTASDQILSFVPGQTSIDVPFTVLDDTIAEPDETVVLELRESTARIVTRHSTAVIRDDDRATELEIRTDGRGFVIFNHGPSAASDVAVEVVTADPYLLISNCGNPCIVGIMPVGTAKRLDVYGSQNSSSYTASVSSALVDPDLSNNSASVRRTNGLIIHCDHISTSGTRVTVLINGERTQDEVITLWADPSSSVSMPSSVVVPAGSLTHEFLIQGLVEGPVTISASGRFDGPAASPYTYWVSASVGSGACALGEGSCIPASITSQPPAQFNVVSGRQFSLSVAAAGSPEIEYSWLGLQGDGPSTVPITLNFPQTANAQVRVSNACGSESTPWINIRSFRRRPADFRAAGVSQTVIYRDGAWMTFSAPAGDVWTGQPSQSCIPAPGDYDGDGVTDLAMFCSGAWHFYNPDGSYLKGIWTGNVAGDLPVPADYDGDGADEVVIFRNNGAWIFYDYDTGAYDRGVWTGGGPGSIPVPGDYDGDGKADFSVYRRGPWHFFNADGSYWKGIWTGIDQRDVPVPGDYFVDGRDEVAIFRAGAWLFYDFESRLYTHGVWTGPGSANGGTLQPAPLDTDGDGTVEFTVKATGPWHFFNDNGSYFRGVWTGVIPNDQAISRRQHTNP